MKIFLYLKDLTSYKHLANNNNNIYRKKKKKQYRDESNSIFISIVGTIISIRIA